MKDEEILPAIQAIINDKLKAGIKDYKLNGDLKTEGGSLSALVSKDNHNHNFTVKLEASKITIKVNSFEIQSELLIKTKSYLKTLFERDLTEIIDQVAE